MSESTVPEKVKIRLWGRAAGRCEYAGCNEPLWLDSLTQIEFNVAYVAHIVADKPDGPRGDPQRSEALRDKLSNLMLMCDRHHRLIDKEDVAGHPEDRLLRMKEEHERRIELVTQIDADRQSTLVFYGANIGMTAGPFQFEEAASAMLPERYPADRHAIELGCSNSSLYDNIAAFWTTESAQLRAAFEQKIGSRLRARTLAHLSVFALAPQPLLVMLGSLLSDKCPADIFPRRKEPPTWTWATEGTLAPELLVQPPASTSRRKAALVVALSATIGRERITQALGEDVPIWVLTVEKPNNDLLRTRQQAHVFRKTMRELLDRIKAIHGESCELHVFPAMPAALAIELGRVHNPKSDLRMSVYDNRHGVFTPALEVPGPP